MMKNLVIYRNVRKFLQSYARIFKELPYTEKLKWCKYCVLSKFAYFYGKKKLSKILNNALHIRSDGRREIMHNFGKISEFLV